MSFKVEQSRLKDAIHKVVSVVDKRNTRPILAYVLFEADGDELSISATDLEVSAKVVLKSKVENKIRFCVNAKNLSDILKELPDSEIELSKNNNQLSLTCEAVHFNLLIYEDGEFPHLNFQSEAEKFTIPSATIIDIISKTSHAISQDETRIHLNGIFLQEIDGQLRAVAIDGHRLALLNTGVEIPSNELLTNGIIIPKKGIQELKKLADSYQDGLISISVDETYLYANLENYHLSVRLITRDYPKYQTVIPSKSNVTINFDRNALLNSVKRVKIMSNEKNNGIKVLLENNRMTFSANNPTYGEAKEHLECEYAEDTFEIGFNARFLIDVLSIFPEGEVNLEVTNELSPVIFKSPSFPNFLSIVMPLKI